MKDDGLKYERKYCLLASSLCPERTNIITGMSKFIKPLRKVYTHNILLQLVGWLVGVIFLSQAFSV